MISFDFTELDVLAAELQSAPEKAGPKLRQAFEVTSRNIKDAWADKLRDQPRLPHASRTITYDIIATPGKTSTLEAEIGSETGRLQATFVTVIEFGSPVNNTAPRGFGSAALQENEADFIKGLELATEVLA